LATKKSTRSSVRKKTGKKTAAKKTSKFATGTYIVPKGHVSIGVPSYWTLRQTNDDLEVEAPSGSTSVIVTAFQRNGRNEPLDAREYLEHFLETAPANGRLKKERGTKNRAVARYRDPEGDHWEVAFVTNGTTLLLATCNTSFPSTHKEAKMGLHVLESVKLF
jgi:hypothetical protein